MPGGVYTDLQNADIIGDILSGFNDNLTRWVAYDSWTYTGKFNGNSTLMRLYLYITTNILIYKLNSGEASRGPVAQTVKADWLWVRSPLEE